MFKVMAGGGGRRGVNRVQGDGRGEERQLCSR